MSALPKIVVGALATAAAAWFLNGPLGLGQRCAAAQGAAVNGSAEIPPPGAVLGPATSEAVSACQDKVSQVASSGAIHFATGGASVAPDSAPLLDQIAASLRDCGGTQVEVGGHTDAQGDAEANQLLSQRRAEAVVDELVRRGIPSSRLTARGYGESRLLDPNGPENNPRNRRIEFTVSAAPTTSA